MERQGHDMSMISSTDFKLIVGLQSQSTGQRIQLSHLQSTKEGSVSPWIRVMGQGRRQKSRAP